MEENILQVLNLLPIGLMLNRIMNNILQKICDNVNNNIIGKVISIIENDDRFIITYKYKDKGQVFVIDKDGLTEQRMSDAIYNIIHAFESTILIDAVI